MAVSHLPPFVTRLRQLTLVTLAAGPAICLAIFLIPIFHTLEWSDLFDDPAGLFGFLLLLLGPYVLLGGMTWWLARTPARATLLATGALILSLFSVIFWYDILVTETSPLAFLALISVHWLQLAEVIVFTVGALVVWAVEHRIDSNRQIKE